MFWIVQSRGTLTKLGALRSSHWRCSVRKVVLRNFANFTGKHLCQSLFFNKIADLRPATLFRKRLWHRCFPVNFVKFLRTSFLQNIFERLFLCSLKFAFLRGILTCSGAYSWRANSKHPGKMDGKIRYLGKGLHIFLG